MGTTQAYNYKGIDDNTGTAGVLSPEQLSCLAAEGYKAVVNLMPDSSEYAVAGEREQVEQQGLGYHYIPVDFAAPTVDDYHRFASTMAQLGTSKVMIHCAANWRVSAFYAIYAHHNLGWDEQRARAHIQSVWEPAEHAPWPQFIDEGLAAGSWAANT